jgi:hypothetical protein
VRASHVSLGLELGLKARGHIFVVDVFSPYFLNPAQTTAHPLKFKVFELQWVGRKVAR